MTKLKEDYKNATPTSKQPKKPNKDLFTNSSKTKSFTWVIKKHKAHNNCQDKETRKEFHFLLQCKAPVVDLGTFWGGGGVVN